MDGFANADTATLRTIRGNLLAGLTLVAGTIEAGTFHAVGPKGAAPPSQAGHLTLALLYGVNAELERRASCARP